MEVSFLPALSPHPFMRRLSGVSRIDAYVGRLSLIAAVGIRAGWSVTRSLSRYRGLSSSLLSSRLLLEGSATKLRGGNAVGSLAFILHLAAVLAFRPVWAAIDHRCLHPRWPTRHQATPQTGLSSTPRQKSSPYSCGRLYLSSWGRDSAVTIVLPGVALPFDVAISDLSRSCGGCAFTSSPNSVMVSGAVAISDRADLLLLFGRPTRFGCWDMTSRRAFSLLLAWLYLFFDNPDGLSRFGFLAGLRTDRRHQARLHEAQYPTDAFDDLTVPTKA